MVNNELKLVSIHNSLVCALVKLSLLLISCIILIASLCNGNFNIMALFIYAIGIFFENMIEWTNSKKQKNLRVMKISLKNAVSAICLMIATIALFVFNFFDTINLAYYLVTAILLLLSLIPIVTILIGTIYIARNIMSMAAINVADNMQTDDRLN